MENIRGHKLFFDKLEQACHSRKIGFDKLEMYLALFAPASLLMRRVDEVHGTFVCARLDMSNGYNAGSRSVLLRRLSEHAGLEHLVPPLHALGAEAPDLLIGAQRRRLFDGRRAA